MKKNIIICAIIMLTAAFSASAQSLDKAKADLQKMVGTWTYSMENPMDSEKISGEITIFKEKDDIFMTLTGFDAPIKTTALKPSASGKVQTTFYVEEYDYDVPLELQLLEDGSIKSSIDAGGFYVEYKMTRKK